ncbi:MAG TPA: lytic transglycosylase domain-containing protein [Gemmatimonadaceae bacterium]|nr:lytic transglycosylase domain-containing protein [Gemmatimonadaceae bacterium]
MPTTSTTKSQGGFRRLAKRYGAQAAIIAVGAAFAVGTMEKTRFLPKPNIVDRPFADALTPKVEAAARPWAILDAGKEHDRIATWVTRLTSGGSKRGVEQTLAKKAQYEDMIKTKLEERKMPADLIYLAMIESNFNPNATSPVKAKGMWQFMAATAREFGLTVTGRTDERTDPAKATDAALTYLQSLKDRFGSWYLAAAAYNSGGGTVSKAMRKTVGRTKGTDEDFWLIMPKLPKETQDYVPKLIATARIGNDPGKYGLRVQEQAGTVDLSAVSAAPPKPATVDKVKTATTVKPKAKVVKKKPVVKKPAAKRPAVKKPSTTKTRRP